MREWSLYGCERAVSGSLVERLPETPSTVLRANGGGGWHGGEAVGVGVILDTGFRRYDGWGWAASLRVLGAGVLDTGLRRYDG